MLRTSKIILAPSKGNFQVSFFAFAACILCCVISGNLVYFGETGEKEVF